MRDSFKSVVFGKNRFAFHVIGGPHMKSNKDLARTKEASWSKENSCRLRLDFTCKISSSGSRSTLNLQT